MRSHARQGRHYLTWERPRLRSRNEGRGNPVGMNDAGRPFRIFIFYPSMNERVWRVVLPGGAKHLFPTEGRAVEFALTSASSVTTGRMRRVEVLKETLSGGWIIVARPSAS